MSFDNLRHKHPQFIYEKFDILQEDGNLKITFHLILMPDIKFNPVLNLPNISKERLDEIRTNNLENLIFNLGMVELLSYWKATCSPEIIIKAGFLDKEQIAWWKDLLLQGLGEFFYQNQIDFTQPDLVKFSVNSNGHPGGGHSKIELKDRDLILVGGGKDSAVTLETLSNKDHDCLLLNPTKAAQDIAEAGGCSYTIIRRTIDPKLLQLNKKGYLNGHTPFSAYLAFLSTLAAHIYDYKNILVSNEASSSDGNVEYHGQMINHQYSKSFEFEKKFRQYCKKYLAAVTYFSFLRPLNELQIARLFSKMEKYHKLFRSCNRGSKMGGVWCGQCSKCLFGYLILYPFLGDKTKEIFGRDLLDDENLAPVMEELLQVEGKFKPFECVGIKEEVQYALFLCIKKYGDQNPPKLLEKFKRQAVERPELLTTWNDQDLLPEEYISLLKGKLNEN